MATVLEDAVKVKGLEFAQALKEAGYVGGSVLIEPSRNQDTSDYSVNICPFTR